MEPVIMTIPNNIRLKINGVLYKQDVKYTDFKVGDLVIDTDDLTWSNIDSIHPDGKHVILKEENVVEVGVHVDRLIKLTPMSPLEVIWHNIKKKFK